MKPTFNRAPLVPNTLAKLPLGSIRPEGWLLDQLRTQAEGLSGKLHQIWEDVGEDCGWLGGSGDGLSIGHGLAHHQQGHRDRPALFLGHPGITRESAIQNHDWLGAVQRRWRNF